MLYILPCYILKTSQDILNFLKIRLKMQFYAFISSFKVDLWHDKVLELFSLILKIIPYWYHTINLEKSLRCHRKINLKHTLIQDVVICLEGYSVMYLIIYSKQCPPWTLLNAVKYYLKTFHYEVMAVFTEPVYSYLLYMLYIHLLLYISRKQSIERCKFSWNVKSMIAIQ